MSHLKFQIPSRWQMPENEISHYYPTPYSIIRNADIIIVSAEMCTHKNSLYSQYLFIGLQMRGHLQKVMSKHRIIWDFTEAKHGRLSEVDHEPDKNKESYIQEMFKEK